MKSPLRISMILWAVCVLIPAAQAADDAGFHPKPVPAAQVVPLPYHQASFQVDGEEMARYHFGPDLNRPFWFPLIGPSGRSLTRMGHPHDPESHSHHNSVWISHNDVNGVSFWADGGEGRIVHQRIVKYTDGDAEASAVSQNHWIAGGDTVVLKETRRAAVRPMENGEWMMMIDLKLEAASDEAVLGQTPFGLIGVRMAKTIGVHDGGGTIRNSEGGVDEEEIFWKRARWVDYSGPIANGAVEGVTLFDHPQNPGFPSHFHVRNDGWMGASLTFGATRTIRPDNPMKLRYGLYINNGRMPSAGIDAVWNRFSLSAAEEGWFGK